MRIETLDSDRLLYFFRNYNQYYVYLIIILQYDTDLLDSKLIDSFIKN